jgi:hypothetical protein
MAYLIERIKQQLAKSGTEPRTTAARDWLMSKIKDLKPTRQALLNDKERLKTNTIIGRMYFYYYDPKLKDELPYYDRFPLVIPIERYQDGFLGLNLHYISPRQRIELLDALSDFATNSKYDETTRLRLSWAKLKTVGKAFKAKPCVKRYLFKHVDSRFLEITADEWDIAALLPFQNFQGATANKVYNDSRNKF